MNKDRKKTTNINFFLFSNKKIGEVTRKEHEALMHKLIAVHEEERKIRDQNKKELNDQVEKFKKDQIEKIKSQQEELKRALEDHFKKVKEDLHCKHFSFFICLQFISFFLCFQICF